ncbi:arsenic transporter [Nitzschia inconspicua]|uniref:Arsenic transporter n=1 Tax=Nitzschia inconspicua TaxID=303405 RepID=A0A9K3LEB8_9STRA|nr:arsenic transporter [Nitzschia inconspicua]
MDIFAKYLTVWVGLAMILGTAIGALVPSIPQALERATVSNVWIPGSVLVWLMVYPMMLEVRWSAIKKIHTNPRGLLLTTFINWTVQPFVMYGPAVLFFQVVFGGLLDSQIQSEFIAGAVILGGSPCTAMVFVWSKLAGGDPNYTLVQVILNDIILLFLYAPTTKLLLNISDIPLPWATVFLSVFLFVVVPFAGGMITHFVVFRQRNGEELMRRIQKFLQPISEMSLILLVVFIFISQAEVIVDSPIDVLLIMVPLLLQTCFVFVLTYSMAYFFCLHHDVAGPAAFIGSSNFFELAVALALTVYGPQSGAVLVTVVGVLVEVPVMLLEVAVVNRTKARYERRLADDNCRCHKTNS